MLYTARMNLIESVQHRIQEVSLRAGSQAPAGGEILSEAKENPRVIRIFNKWIVIYDNGSINGLVWDKNGSLWTSFQLDPNAELYNSEAEAKRAVPVVARYVLNWAGQHRGLNIRLLSKKYRPKDYDS